MKSDKVKSSIHTYNSIYENLIFFINKEYNSIIRNAFFGVGGGVSGFSNDYIGDIPVA